MNGLALERAQSILSQLGDILIKLNYIAACYSDDKDISENIEASITFFRGIYACTHILVEELTTTDN
jgi:hypothetical protein